MSARVLVANRGEIAVRIVRTCRRMGLGVTAVFSMADRHALHVAVADDAVCLGAADALGSYLDIDAVLDAAARTGAAAIHPGYGFLAENAGFAERCRAAGLIFIGPASGPMRQMGSKISAKQAARDAGVPVIPGSVGNAEDDASLRRLAADLGPPVMIKATAGGGGRGMRLVTDLNEFDAALQLARAEAQAGFDDGAVFIERALAGARHIEVQIVADQHGNVLHFHDRDCSVQRLHQKIAEEAPAPALSPATRHALLGHAVRLAQGIGYDSVGTIEFLVEPGAEALFFLEMNTRLQVEHTVTEMITGIDLVECQIRSAFGEALPFRQADIARDGHAIEVRVAAERAEAGFAPAFGRVELYAEPELDGVRIDSGIRAGAEIGPYYDSLLAKVIAHGADRTAALSRLESALKSFRITGVRTNLGFLRALVSRPAFVAGAAGTDFIAREFPAGWREPDDLDLSAAIAATAWVLARRAVEAAPGTSAWRALGAWRVTAAAGRAGAAYISVADDDDTVIDLRVEQDEAGRVTVAGDAGRVVFDSAYLADACVAVEQGGVARRAALHIAAHTVTIHLSGATRRYRVLPPAERYLGSARRSEARDEFALMAPMPGLVTVINVAVGDAVERGQTVLVLEAMKLLHPLDSPMAGTVAAVHCAAGDTVAGGRVLIEFNPAQEDK